jgi:hypothetical protein
MNIPKWKEKSDRICVFLRTAYKKLRNGKDDYIFFSKNDSNARIAYVELDVAFRVGFGLERLGR